MNNENESSADQEDEQDFFDQMCDEEIQKLLNSTSKDYDRRIDRAIKRSVSAAAPQEADGTAKLVVRTAIELITQNKILRYNEQGIPFFCASKSFTYPSGFKISDWSSLEHDKPFFVNNEACYLFYEWGWVNASIEGDEIEISVTGKKKESEDWLTSQHGKHGFLDKVKYINWMFGPNYKNMQVRRVPLDVSEPLPGAYPWLKQSVEEYANGYFNNKASVLILIGPPGTGKTSFLKGLIAQMKGQACVTYDSHLLQEDGIFAQFTEDRDMEAMIFEDADNFIGSRRDGNQMMHRFLNVSNGLVSPMKGKKIIFTTNLPSADEIDPALIRPGRCYEVLHFRNLESEEAQVVANHFYGEGVHEMEKHRTYTLAEVTNFSQINGTKVKRNVGFY